MTQSTLDIPAAVRAELRAFALFGALFLGGLADWLLRADGGPGINVTLWVFAVITVIAWLLKRRGEAVTKETCWLLGGSLLFAAALVWRSAEALAVFTVLATVVLGVLAAGRATTPWLATAQVSDVIFACIRVAGLSLTGPVDWGSGRRIEAGAMPAWQQRMRTGARGIVIALPAFVLLAALLMSADPVFSRIIRNTFQIDPEVLGAHFACTVVVAWLGAGYLRALLIHDTIAADLRVTPPAFTAAEISVALWILNLLFLSFMIVQLRYLFGGADLVQARAGLSYAEYARSGFFELVWTVLLVVPILLLADWAAATDTTRARRMLHATSLVLVVLLFGVIASAVYRMRVYQGAYGLTEQRLYVSVFLVWLTVVICWLALTVLRGQRDRFVFGAFLAGIVALISLHLMNPDALIARVNLDRAAAGASYDGTYLTSLSADAVPVILERLDTLPIIERCRIEGVLRTGWGGARPGGWLTWNVSDARARVLVAERGGTAGCGKVAVDSVKKE